MAGHDSNPDEGGGEGDEQWQDEGDLDRRLASGAAPRSHLDVETRRSKMASRNWCTRPPPAHVTRASATAAAPSKTRAYSAVACPASFRFRFRFRLIVLRASPTTRTIL